jgi:hypothetical protein
MASSLRGISAPYLCIAVIVQGEASLSATFGATFRADFIFLLVIVPARCPSPIHEKMVTLVDVPANCTINA